MLTTILQTVPVIGIAYSLIILRVSLGISHRGANVVVSHISYNSRGSRTWRHSERTSGGTTSGEIHSSHCPRSPRPVTVVVEEEVERNRYDSMVGGLYNRRESGAGSTSSGDDDRTAQGSETSSVRKKEFVV